MAMLINGVKPPKSCYVCGWYNKVDCPVHDGKCYYRNGRHPSCPLVEVSPCVELAERLYRMIENETLFNADNARQFLKDNPPKGET